MKSVQQLLYRIGTSKMTLNPSIEGICFLIDQLFLKETKRASFEALFAISEKFLHFFI